LHQVGTSSLLIYMMHGHTYIKLHVILIACPQQQWLYERAFVTSHVQGLSCCTQFLYILTFYSFQYWQYKVWPYVPLCCSTLRMADGSRCRNM